MGWAKRAVLIPGCRLLGVWVVGVLFVAIGLRGRMIERAQPGNLRNQSWALKMSFIHFGDLHG